ncbi:AbrB/MazE/SpoVT family DNA-binding domain-containing protein [Acidithiobacillus sp. 'AMD consortium']|uniref:antitoxin n=1 Tax=Acidithiobacillus sp. 'AMD consortium' TaxID=2614801 RepID=UPI00124ED431|nr:type II toxin-antitoxin system VapB family antitoxin [Acidithiobacillus sp. 'AMD consortium']QFG79206.1 AbrB/MazE/SpoVT family DNA-binding domain-containing protein [Acidithiobacillus sp. 'AMD consortium']
MTKARVFMSGNSQAVRLPKEFRFRTEEVAIFRRGDEIVLRERAGDASEIFDLLVSLPDDFLAEGRQDTIPQQREGL